MSSPDSPSRTNKELLIALSSPRARFYPFDLHTHSIASHDVCHGPLFAKLPESLKNAIAGSNTSAPETLTIEDFDEPFQLPDKECQGISLPLKKEPIDRQKHDREVANTKFVNAFYAALRDRRDAIIGEDCVKDNDKWSLIAITDHDTAHFSSMLSEHAWKSRAQDQLVILPGLELEVVLQIESDACALHILCVFAPCTSAAHILLAINQAVPKGTASWDLGNTLHLTSLPEFISGLRNHPSHPAICIAAHVWSNKGVQKESKKVLLESLEAAIIRLEGVLAKATHEKDRKRTKDAQDQLASLKNRKTNINLEVLKLIGSCGFDGLQVRDQSHEQHFRKLHRFRENHGRAVPIACSDSHSPEDVFNSVGNLPYIKLDVQILRKGTEIDVFNHIKRRALCFGETRTTYAQPASVSHWIEGIEIVPDAKDARQFWCTGDILDGESKKATFTLPLSRNLNCFIGGRGSGKSSLIEAVSFLVDRGSFAAEAAKSSKRAKDVSDWYHRAKATLSGCKLRLVWRTSSVNGFGVGANRSLFVTRYFDPEGRFEEPEIRDINGDTVVDGLGILPNVQLLRAHDIEKTADSDNLRLLFDELCGKDIFELSGSIEALRTELKNQRLRIIEVCQQLAELTKSGGALRQYGVRKQQFDAVDQPEIRVRFEQVDNAESISKVVSFTNQQWNEIGGSEKLSKLEAKLAAFFDATETWTHDGTGSIREGYEPLAALVGPSTDADTTGIREVVIGAVQTAKVVLDQASESFASTDVDAKATLRKCRDDLASDGLPTGSGERDTKKRAYEEAKEAYQSYQGLLLNYDALLSERSVTFEQLVQKSKERTTRRKRHAESLTLHLRGQLDQDVLRIEVRANELNEREEFRQWLETHISRGIGARFSGLRVEAIIRSNLMPSALRAALLELGQPDWTGLKNDIARADDGRINEADCIKFFDVCHGVHREPLEESTSWNAEFVSTLPNELTAGVIVFPSEGRSLNIDHVLALDEVILDDSPEILLNDRPTESESVPRPLRELSPGQRCSAILPLLLLSGEYPLIIDQPEENLDNRLIRQVIVNILASMKLKRQIIIATHNPNLPVLGDAEQCVLLQSTGRDRSRLIAEGSLDSSKVANYITDIMEGGREAFQYRQSIYQTHWESDVDEFDATNA